MEGKRMAEYIDKHEAYTLLKDLEAAYIYPPVKEAYATAARHIDQMKTADVQPVKRGHWEKLTIVPATDTGNCILARCSKCGDTVFYTVTGREITLKYCPNCGARMDLGDEKT